MRPDRVRVRSRDPERITWLTLWNVCPKNTNECSHWERRQQTPHEFAFRRPLAARAVWKVVAISQCSSGAGDHPLPVGRRARMPVFRREVPRRQPPAHRPPHDALGHLTRIYPAGRMSLSARPELAKHRAGTSMGTTTTASATSPRTARTRSRPWRSRSEASLTSSSSATLRRRHSAAPWARRSAASSLARRRSAIARFRSARCGRTRRAGRVRMAIAWRSSPSRPRSCCGSLRRTPTANRSRRSSRR